MKSRTANIGFALWGLKCFYETFVQGSTFGFQMNFCAKNPPQRKAENRYAQCYDDRATDEHYSLT